MICPRSTPILLTDGETPVKAEGKLYVIDGGISKAYRTQTGIAGYTLIYNSHHLALAEHTISLEETKEAGNKQVKISPVMKVTETMARRVLVGDTDMGEVIREKIKDLKKLVKAYEDGVLS